MMRFGSQHSVLPLQQCLTRMVIKRHFSFFMKTAGSEEQAAQSNLFWAAAKQTEIGRMRFLNAIGRSLTTNAQKGDMILENESDVEKRERTTYKSIDEKSEISRNLEKMKHLIGTPVLKEENLNMFWKLSQGDPEVFNELRTWQMRINILFKFFGATLNMNEESWEDFLKGSENQKERYFTFLIGTAIRKQKNIKNLHTVPLPYEDDDDDVDNFDDPMCYHLFHNSMFLSFRQMTLRRLLYARGMVSVLHGPEIFIDCSYEDYMNKSDCKYLAKQIINGVRKNLLSNQPFHIVLCNFNRNGWTGKHLKKNSPLLLEDCHPVTHSARSYLDFCPREKLVYLSPHCSTNMIRLEPDKRYIIGGYVDKSNQKRVSLAKAKENNIEIQKFPIDNYLNWKFGKKTLCVNHVMAVLLALKDNNNDWIKAFEELPKRYVTRDIVGKKRIPESKVRMMANRILSLGSIKCPGKNL